MTGLIPPVRGHMYRVSSPMDILFFHYNPEYMTVTKTPKYTSRPQRGAKVGEAHQEFIGYTPSTLNMKLMFDAVSDFGMPRSVKDSVEKLVSWTWPTRSSSNAGTPQPATIQLFWGAASIHYFPPCRIKTMKTKYTRFDQDGSASRAEITITLVEAANTLGPQNPTSGGVVGRRSVTVDAGDTLAAVAYAEYGNPNMWRALAEANNIDDPLRLRPGATLFIPAKADADRLVRGGDV